VTRVAVSRREFEPDIYGVAMPVFGPGGKVIAAIEVGAANLDDDLHRIMSPLLIATRSLSREVAGGAAPATDSVREIIPHLDAITRSGPVRMKSTVAHFGGDHATKSTRNGAHVPRRSEEPGHDNDYRPEAIAEMRITPHR
jgi:hypothetical protein